MHDERKEIQANAYSGQHFAQARVAAAWITQGRRTIPGVNIPVQRNRIGNLALVWILLR
jgi:hypothetical protein